MEVLHADNHLLVVAKPAGLPVVPDASGDESLLDRARAWVEREYGKPGRAFLGVVHRLDRPVSGVVVLARTSKAARRLSEAFRERAVEKVYWGVARDEPREPAGELEQLLWKDRAGNRVRVVAGERPGARLARTRWRVLARAGEGAARRVLLELVPETGRPHPLRVAAATLGGPLLGDTKYGAAARSPGRADPARPALPDGSIALHARSLAFPHPVRDETLRFACEPPALEVWRF